MLVGTVILCSVLAPASLVPATASAQGSFGAKGEGAGEFESPTGIAVEQESGDVYVVDRNNARVDKFSAAGQFLLAWGWNVRGDGGEGLQACTSRCIAGVEGAEAGQFSGPEGVAVDNDPLSASHGDVYVVDGHNHRVEKFDASGAFVLTFGGEVNVETKANVCVAGEHCGTGTEGGGHGEFESTFRDAIAVDHSGDIYVGDSERVQKFSPGGAFQEQIALPGVGQVEGLAVDSSDNLYVNGSEFTGIRKYDDTGAELEELDGSGVAGAVDVGTGDALYVVDNSEPVQHLLKYDAAGTLVARFDASTIESELNGIAYAEAGNQLDVVDPEAVRIANVPPPGPLVVEAKASPGETPTTASIQGALNPEGHEVTYLVEYGTTTSYGESTTTQTLTGTEFADEPVSPELSGLAPQTTYHFRIVAKTVDGTTLGPDGTVTTLSPALISEEAVTQVTSTSARLGAIINPLGAETTYQFEYGSTTAYGQVIPASDGDAGDGTANVPVSAVVEGLTPGTEYHMRLMAHNSFGDVVGPDVAFVTQHAETVSLSDGRAWEMVSPVDKRGVSLEALTAEGGLIQSSATGDRFTYIAKAPISEDPAGNRSIANTQLLAERGAGVWSAEDVTTKHEEVVGLRPGFPSEYKSFSPDLSIGIVEPDGATPLSSRTTERTPYLREQSGEYVPLVTAENVPPGTKFGSEEVGPGFFTYEVTAVASSADDRHVVLSSLSGLTSDFAGDGVDQNLYEWTDGALKMVSMLPNNVPAGAEGMTSLVGFNGENVRNAVSEDGNRVVFGSEANGVEGLYLRDLARGETVQLDAPEPGVTVGPQHANPRFQLASNDGTRIFFTDATRLTADSTAKRERPDLYMCEVTSGSGALGCHLRDLTVDENPGEAADVLGLAIGADEHGSFIYFVADGALTAGAEPGTCVESGQGEPSLACNLYEVNVTSGQAKLVARLSNSDAPDWTARAGRDLIEVTARVAPDGQSLAFMSERSLTGYDNRDAASGERDEEVFLYKLADDSLSCASCDPSGARPHGILVPHEFPGLLVDRPRVWGDRWVAGFVPGWTAVDNVHATYQSRYLADSGRLIFDSSDALVPQDLNGKEDVYQFEPDGVGSCDEANGCVSLISSGSSGEESAFLDASVSGDDIFFLTASQLVKKDIDHAFDVYDAHVCTAAVPCTQEPAAAPVPCDTTDSCRAAAPPVTSFAPPSSASPGGSGNIVPSPPVKPKVVPLTRKQKLNAALAQCKRAAKRVKGAKKARQQRKTCEARARKRYGPPHPAKRSKNRRTKK
jgi:hypothetical protein